VLILHHSIKETVESRWLREKFQEETVSKCNSNNTEVKIIKKRQREKEI
jgi:hypothetical protein